MSREVAAAILAQVICSNKGTLGAAETLDNVIATYSEVLARIDRLSGRQIEGDLKKT